MNAMDLRALHLCAGAGGGMLGGLLVGHMPVCAVEIDPYCQRVLIQRQRDGLLPPFPIWDDCRTFDGHAWHGRVDIIHAGFPCQPFSFAGKQQSAADERNLWPHIDRIIGAVRPRYVFLENVPALAATAYFGTILGHLTARGYDTVWTIIGADDVGASHRRKRLWILANARCQRLEARWIAGESAAAGSVRYWKPQCGRPPVGHPDRQQCPEQQQPRAAETPWSEPRRAGWWQAEPPLGRVVDGLAHRVDRLRALGNGQVPLCTAVAWRVLLTSIGTGEAVQLRLRWPQPGNLDQALEVLR